MKYITTILWLMPLLFAVQVNACEYPTPPDFSKVAPTAVRIFVFRVMRLNVREQSVTGSDGHVNYFVGADADVLVQRTFRGETSNISTIRFYNGVCGGVNLIIGHHYLIATNQTAEVIELAPADGSLGDIDPLNYDPSPSADYLETNKYVIAVAAALEGKKPFDLVLDAAAHQSVSTVPPPPEIKIVTEPCKPKPKPVKKASTQKKAK